MLRPCGARGFRRFWLMRSCINVSGFRLERVAPSHHGYQRACDLISGQASNGPFGSPMFAWPVRPILHRRLILSQTSAGKGVGYVINSLLASRCSFVRALRPFLRSGLRSAKARRGAAAGRRDRPGG
jgi:hypothetical protein